MNATSLPKVKKALRNVNLVEARDLLQEVLQMEDATEIHNRLQLFLASHGMEQFIHNPVA
jgi:phosphotransferase system enzyme I (PtsP)